jgi:hypothetical protein
MLGKKFDHQTVIEPGLLHLAGMASPGQDFQFAIRDARLEREAAWMTAVFAAGQNDCWAVDTLMMIFRIRLCESFELVDY